MKLLAFHVWDKEAPTSEEALHEIIFAETSGKAKYASEAYSMSREFTDLRAKRVPEFDQYAEQKKVPIDVMVANGWTFECTTCNYYADDNGLVFNEEIYCEECAEKIYIEDGKVYIKDEEELF